MVRAKKVEIGCDQKEAVNEKRDERSRVEGGRGRERQRLVHGDAAALISVAEMDVKGIERFVLFAPQPPFLSSHSDQK